MPRRHSCAGWRKGLDLALSIATAVIMYPAAATAQVSAPLVLPPGPAKPGFDITRFNSEGYGWFETFYVKDTQPLRNVLEQGKLAGDTRVLVTETAGGRLALLMDQMAHHHVAQGHAGGKDWMATF